MTRVVFRRVSQTSVRWLLYFIQIISFLLLNFVFVYRTCADVMIILCACVHTCRAFVSSTTQHWQDYCRHGLKRPLFYQDCDHVRGLLFNDLLPQKDDVAWSITSWCLRTEALWLRSQDLFVASRLLAQLSRPIWTRWRCMTLLTLNVGMVGRLNLLGFRWCCAEEVKKIFLCVDREERFPQLITRFLRSCRVMSRIIDAAVRWRSMRTCCLLFDSFRRQDMASRTLQPATPTSAIVTMCML